MSPADTGAARAIIDDAARGLSQADIELGDPGADFGHVERLLLDALNLTLQALGMLRGLTR